MFSVSLQMGVVSKILSHSSAITYANFEYDSEILNMLKPDFIYPIRRSHVVFPFWNNYVWTVLRYVYAMSYTFPHAY